MQRLMHSMRTLPASCAAQVVLAQPDNLVYRVRKFVRRHRFAIAAVALLTNARRGPGHDQSSSHLHSLIAQRDQALLAQPQLLTQAAAARLNLGGQQRRHGHHDGSAGSAWRRNRRRRSMSSRVRAPPTRP